MNISNLEGFVGTIPSKSRTVETHGLVKKPGAQFIIGTRGFCNPLAQADRQEVQDILYTLGLFLGV